MNTIAKLQRSVRHPGIRAKGANRRGAVLLLSLIFIAIAAALSLAMSQSVRIDLSLTTSQAGMYSAQTQAEGGLEYLSYCLQNATLGSGSTPLEVIKNALVNYSGDMFSAASVSGGVVNVPAISTGTPGESFTAQIAEVGTGTYCLTVTGHANNTSRSVSMDFIEIGSSGILKYGLATRGPISLRGGAYIRGVNSSAEADVFTAYNGTGQTVYMCGSGTIEGDLSIQSTAADIQLNGNPSIGGVSYWGTGPNGEGIMDHITMGVEGGEFPEIDTSVFEPYATNLVTEVKSHYDPVLDKWVNTFDNVRIKANSNPTICSDTIIRGVIYIESPNIVSFQGGCSLQAVIVTEDAGDDATDKNQIYFRGGATCTGIESLPDLPQFDGLRDLKGSFLLAPGFYVDMRGGFGTVGGMIACEELNACGGATGTVAGSILIYGDQLLDMGGGSNFLIDKSDPSSQSPAGIVTSRVLSPVVGTFCGQ